MRSDTNKLDLLRDSPERQQYPDDVRRYAYYLRESEKLEEHA